MNDMYIFNFNGINCFMNYCLKLRLSKWMDGFFFGVYILRLFYLSKYSDFFVVVLDILKNLRYFEMF